MEHDGTLGRIARALAGEAVEPPVAGLSFVPPGVLPGLAADPAPAPAHALARACADARLDLVFAPAREEWAPQLVREAHESGVAAWWVVDGPVWRALGALGLDAGLRASVREPGVLRSGMRDALEAALPLVRRGLELGADALVVADDLAGAGGPLFPPAFVEAEIAPLLAELIEPARVAGVACVLHSDGDMRLLLAAVASAGFAAVHGDLGGAALLEAAAASARAAGLALVGGIPTSALGSPMSAVAAGSLAAGLARAGGVLVCDDGGVETREQAAALFAALGAARG